MHYTCIIGRILCSKNKGIYTCMQCTTQFQRDTVTGYKNVIIWNWKGFKNSHFAKQSGPGKKKSLVGVFPKSIVK